MKTQLIVFIAALGLACNTAAGQDLHWGQLQKDQQHFIAAKFGGDYATILGVAYGYRLAKTQPAFINAEFSAPFGTNILDDWKFRLAYQRQVWQGGDLALSLKPGMIVRTYASNIAKILNVGLELNTSLGYYRPKWFLAVEAGVDHTLASNLNQGSLKENYPGIYEGWVGSTGGNFKFGANMGHSLGKQLVSLRLGKVYARNFQDNPTLPFYFELALVKVW